ncbi:hypothetical protein [Haloferula sargassicola]|uniref:DUF1772 domain-containing protein n=1 Tax=Haloferula sargassicola TaxID=490096 RepID=A0ABP9USF6_9BACT
MFLPKLNALSALCALGLFFLPWLDLRCSGRPVLTQTGFQTITGSYKRSADFEIGSRHQIERQLDPDRPPRALLVAGALAATILALLLAFGGMIYGAPDGGALRSGLLAALALVLLVMQDSRGFPLDEETRADRNPHEMAARALVGGTLDVRRTLWFHATLGTLGFSTLIGLNALVDRSRRKR